MARRGRIYAAGKLQPLSKARRDYDCVRVSLQSFAHSLTPFRSLIHSRKTRFDLTAPDTFSNAIKWNQEADRYGRENTVRLLVGLSCTPFLFLERIESNPSTGNKTDIASEQTEEAAIDMASEWTDS